MNTTAVRRQKRTLIAEVQSRMIALKVKELPLSSAVPYSYFDDHEDNEGDLDSVVIEDGDVCGSDLGATVRLSTLDRSTVQLAFDRIVWPPVPARAG